MGTKVYLEQRGRPVVPAQTRRKHEGQKFKDILGYILSSRSARDT